MAALKGQFRILAHQQRWPGGPPEGVTRFTVHACGHRRQFKTHAEADAYRRGVVDAMNDREEPDA